MSNHEKQFAAKVSAVAAGLDNQSAVIFDREVAP